MKNSLLFLAFAGMLLSSTASNAQTTVNGNLTANTVWTVSSSPYRLVGDVGVPPGITLTIEPGVRVDFKDTTSKIQVQGRLLAAGTAANKIVFDASDRVTGMMIFFRKTNLDSSKISNAHFIGKASTFQFVSAIQLAQESEWTPDNPKNSGVLVVDGCTFDYSSVQTTGYSTTASLLMTDCELNYCTIWGLATYSEPITVRNSTILNSTIRAGSYNYEITIEGSTVKNSEFDLECCGAKFNISNSTVLNSTMGRSHYTDGGTVKLSNSLIVETPIDLESAHFEISRCLLVYSEISGPEPLDTATTMPAARFGSGTIVNSTFVGNRNNTELQVSDVAYYYTNTIDISKSTFIGASTALRFSKVKSATISKTSFVNSGRYNVENLTSFDITAAGNYWGTEEAAEAAAKILDSHDNLNYGVVSIEPILTVPDADAPVTPPQNAGKWLSSGLMRLSWGANQESDIAGYRIYYGNFTGYSFSNSVDVGNVTTTTLQGVSLDDTIAVTAYDSQADGTNDQIEGHESWYAISTVASLPVPPALAAPANGLSACSTSVTLKWNAAEGAAAYHVQVASDPLFDNLVVSDSTVSTTSKQIRSLANNMTYYWRVRSANARGASSYSSVWSFKTTLAQPALASPGDSTLNRPLQLTLKVNAVAGASGYHWQVWVNSTFSPVVVDDSTTGVGDTARAVVLSPKTEYFWRVSAFNSNEESAFSATRRFTTTLPVPTAVWPIETMGEPRRAIFRWNRCAGAAGYHLQVATDLAVDSTGGFVAHNVVFDTTLSDTCKTLSVPLEARTTYYWHVNAKDNDGESPYSSVWMFRTTLAEPLLASPGDNAANQPLQITLTVNAVEGASGYRWQVSLNSAFSPVVIDDSTTGAADTARAVVLSLKTRYFWRVGAFDSSGQSEFSGIRSFTTSAAFPLALSPVGTTSEPRRTTFRWSHSEGANGYHLQVASDSTIDSTGGFLADNVVFDTTLTDTSSTLSVPLEASTTYYWHVSAKHADGESIYSAVGSFTTGTGVDAIDIRAGIPARYALSQNYPNPFNPTTVVLYDLPERSYVSLTIYDMLGRKVRTLLNQEKPAGSYQLVIDAGGLPSGVYFYRLFARSLSGRAGEFTQTRKLMVIR